MWEEQTVWQTTCVSRIWGELVSPAQCEQKDFFFKWSLDRIWKEIVSQAQRWMQEEQLIFQISLDGIWEEIFETAQRRMWDEILATSQRRKWKEVFATAQRFMYVRIQWSSKQTKWVQTVRRNRYENYEVNVMVEYFFYSNLPFVPFETGWDSNLSLFYKCKHVTRSNCFIA